MKYYSSDDASAPQIPVVSAPGAFLLILKAVLVIGYGAKTSAGWTNPYNTGTTVAVFKQGAGGNNRFFRFWDAMTVPNSYILRHVCFRGYENMTAVSTGTGPFPTTTQQTGNGLFLPYKDETTFDTGGGVYANPKWKIWADEKTVVFALNPSGNGTSWITGQLGSFDSNKTTDTFNDMVSGNPSEYLHGNQMNYDSFGSMYVTRDYTGSGSSIPACIGFLGGPCVTTTMGFGTYQYPDPITNSLLMQKTMLCTSPTSDSTLAKVRGSLRWIWDTPHNLTLSLPPPSTFTGTGTLAGKTFESVGTGPGAFIVETSDTWS